MLPLLVSLKAAISPLSFFYQSHIQICSIFHTTVATVYGAAAAAAEAVKETEWNRNSFKCT